MNGLCKGLLIGLPMIVYLIASSLIGTSPASLREPTVAAVSAAFAAGMLEELAYRGVLVSTLMRKWKNCGNKYVMIAVISGAAFGLIHLANLGAGADLSRTLNQVVGACFNGIFFAALFMRTGSIWPSVIYHIVNNTVAFATSPDIEENMMLTAPAGLANYIDTGLLFVLAVYGI